MDAELMEKMKKKLAATLEDKKRKVRVAPLFDFDDVIARLDGEIEKALHPPSYMRKLTYDQIAEILNGRFREILAGKGESLPTEIDGAEVERARIRVRTEKKKLGGMVGRKPEELKKGEERK